jgi:surfeit locus 1 family protein
MIALGFWQLGRSGEKTALITRYQAVTGNPAAVAYPFKADAEAAALYRRSQVDCDSVISVTAVNGVRADGAKGWAHKAVCRTVQEQQATVALGFSATPQSPSWQGGLVSGIVAPGPRLVADPPLAGLQPLAKPNPGDLPNNHFAYAMQWFLFAATALIIYALALRRRPGGQ